MPELPEVETVRRMLGPSLEDRRVRQIDILRNDFVQEGLELIPSLEGSVLGKLWRRGKFLFLDSAAGVTTMMHLGMTGHLYMAAAGEEIVKHTHAIWRFGQGKSEFRHVDPRRFGRLAFYQREELERASPFGRLGTDALTVTRKEFREILQSRNRMLKALLLDQSAIAGLGNIYIDEALFLAGLNPRSRSQPLSDAKCDELWRCVRRVLRASIRAGGSSVNTYRHPDGAAGWYQLKLWVYGRKGQLCRRCGAGIESSVVAARTTHFCPDCQS